MVWETVETYCGCKIQREWMEGYDAYRWTSPCIVGFYWKKSAVKKRIEAAGYCDGGVPTGPTPPSGLNRAYLGFTGSSINKRMEQLGVRKVLSAELELFGKALFTPLEVNAFLGEDSDKWDENKGSWYYQPKATTTLVGKTTVIPKTTGWYSVPLDLSIIGAVRNPTLQLKGREAGVNSYCYADDRESPNPPRIVVKGVKVE